MKFIQHFIQFYLFKANILGLVINEPAGKAWMKHYFLLLLIRYDYSVSHIFIDTSQGSTPKNDL